MNDYSGIADLYDLYVTDTSDHPFWARWAAKAAGPILELTAGTGRATTALRAGSGHPVVALDLAPAMLERLVARFRCGSGHVHAVAGDLTELPFAGDRFDLVVIPFNSFGEIIEAHRRAAALREMCRVLTTSGRAVVTLHNPARRRRTLDGSVQRLGPFSASAQVDPCELRRTRRSCAGAGSEGAQAGTTLEVLVRGRLLGPNLAESEQTYRVFDAAGRLVDERAISLRFVLPDAVSLTGMAEAAGLELQSVFGDYDESPYAPASSPFIVAVLRRA